MIGLAKIAAMRARMIIALIVLSIVAGAGAYTSLPKEGEPDIEIPAIFISVPFPGISAEDAERLIVEPIETEMSNIDGLQTMTSTAVENYANIVLEFEFGWDKSARLADVRAAMETAQATFPDGAEAYSVGEFNFSEFPIMVVSLSGDVPERTLISLASDMQERLEALEPVLEVSLSGARDEMVEAVIDPLRLEAYDMTAAELIGAVRDNNLLVAAGEIEAASGAFGVRIPSSFETPADVMAIPVRAENDSVVTLGDVARVGLAFEDPVGLARRDGAQAIALQIVKRKGFNLIDTADLVEETVAASRENWPDQLRQAIAVRTSNDQSRNVRGMIAQLEGSVLTAVALVMIVSLAAMGMRSALLVGFAIPTSFLLCFLLLAVAGIPISNIVMFGLILAVGMLVDGAIVVVEYADKRIREGMGPMQAYVAAADRMFWPVVSSTATTLCAFLPMLFWPGVAGEFMGMLPVTLIFVLSASLVVALVYLPVVGGVAGRITRQMDIARDSLRDRHMAVRLACLIMALGVTFAGALLLLDGRLAGGLAFATGVALLPIVTSALGWGDTSPPRRDTSRPSAFGRAMRLLVGTPLMPIAVIAGVGLFVWVVFATYADNNLGLEFFVETEPEQAIVYVRARGNLSLEDKDTLVAGVERAALETPGVGAVFASTGEGGLNANTGGGSGPRDAIGQVQVELVPWEDRPRARDTVRILGIPVLERERVDPSYDGQKVLADLEERLGRLPGVRAEISELAQGPAQGKPVQLRVFGSDLETLAAGVERARAVFETTPGLVDIDDTRPLPGLDWEIDVDVAEAGRYGADVSDVGMMVQLATRGVTLDTMRVPSSEEEIDIRARLPDDSRTLDVLDTLRTRTTAGLVPLSNFVTREPVPALGRIDRVDGTRHYDIRADVAPDLVKIVESDYPGRVQAVAPAQEVRTDSAWSEALAEGTAQAIPVTPTERIAVLTDRLDTSGALNGMRWEWTGDQEDQAESRQFLTQAFAAALGLMFIILLAQFNSFYNAVLVLVAVVLSTTGVLIGMMVMNQPFSIIMTGTGIVALAGIVVNNNIVLIDTYQEYARAMPRLEAITRTAEARLRPVLLTTLTTMAGLTPMMFGVSIDFLDGGYDIDSPTALWWKQLATAVVFGLGVATILTLVLTPALLALRVWVGAGAARLIPGRARSSGTPEHSAETQRCVV